MKQIVGYLLDRATGLGVSGKTVSFQKLNGTAIAAADTYYLNKSSVTDADGRFFADMELSPGPVNVVVSVSAGEIKVRKHDEAAKLGLAYSSDISRLARAEFGVVYGFLSALSLSTPGGHTIRVGTGMAIFNGAIFSIEQNHLDIAGSANSNAAINPRLDLITLRQYNETAAGQLSGKQEVIVTAGSSTNVVPNTPTGLDFVDFPLGVVSTAYNASSKTYHSDRRVFTNVAAPHQHSLIFGQNSILGSISPNNGSTLVVECPPGLRSTGGGHTISGTNVYVLESYAASTTSWRCAFHNIGSGSRSIGCYVACIDDITTVV